MIVQLAKNMEDLREYFITEIVRITQDTERKIRMVDIAKALSVTDSTLYQVVRYRSRRFKWEKILNYTDILVRLGYFNKEEVEGILKKGIEIDRKIK
jgi:predicted transcriptional regulator